MKKVAVFGAHGNMGRRYCLILKKYSECEVVEVEQNIVPPLDEISSCDGFIVATPTHTHIPIIWFLAQFKKPILCEKPITKSMLELKELYDSHPDLDLSMVNQYEFLDCPNYEGHTWYNYFKTGNDGLLWDCINIIGVARSSYSVLNESLIWDCQLNGKYLDFRDIDHAYIHNIDSWVTGWRNKEYILKAHEKVWKALNDQTN